MNNNSTTSTITMLKRSFPCLSSCLSASHSPAYRFARIPPERASQFRILNDHQSFIVRVSALRVKL
jgi:hypothetical protein